MDEILSVWTGPARAPGALVWILLLVVGTKPTTFISEYFSVEKRKGMADRKKLLVSAVSKPVNDGVAMIP